VQQRAIGGDGCDHACFCMVGSVHAFYLVVLTRQGAPVIDELDRLKGGGNDILKVRNWEDGR
jgi:hypothetical protein